MQKRHLNRPCRRVTEKRRIHRLLCSDLIRLRWSRDGGGSEEVVAILEDYSRAGASLFIGVPVAVGTRTILHTSRGDVTATVRHCEEAPNGYLAGISFDSEVPDYLPSHALDPDRLEFND